MKSFQCDIQSCSSSKENDQELKLVTSIISLRLKLIYDDDDDDDDDDDEKPHLPGTDTRSHPPELCIR